MNRKNSKEQLLVSDSFEFLIICGVKSGCPGKTEQS